MANYATDADLQKFIPSILENGVASFTDHLTLATADVLEMVKLDWWVNAVQSRYGINAETTDFGNFMTNFDETKVNTLALVNLTCYRALHRYICPMLTTDSDESDEWTRKEKRYKQYFDEEWASLKRQALYDFDGDAVFEDIERRKVRGFRTARA